MNKQIILIFISCYVPGYKSGGPVRTVANIVEHLGDEFDFRIVTRDRDKGDSKPYKNILINQWQQVGKAHVCYVSPGQSSWIYFKKIIQNTPFDVLYLNSFFDFTYSGKPLMAYLLSKMPSKPVILAPRGEFSKGALELKRIKKKTYIALTSVLNLYQNIVWHASSAEEREDIKRQSFIKSKVIHVALDPPSCISNDPVAKEYSRVESSGRLRILFLSRIAPMKNLEFALNVLTRLKANVVFDIYGPTDDVYYWRRCQSLIEIMPSHIEVNYCGSVPYELVSAIFPQYDLFFLPTKGENYGHVIAESLTAGTPVLISDRTPWKNLSKEGLGWEFPLENEWAFVQCIDEAALQSDLGRESCRSYIQSIMKEKLMEPDVIEANRQLFLKSLQDNGASSFGFEQASFVTKFKKIYRYARIYNMKYAVVKAMGRTRIPLPVSLILAPFKRCKTKDIAMIGCGQFAFGIIAFYLTKHFGRRFGLCFDVDESAMSSFAKSYVVPHQNIGAIDEACLGQIKMAYIASNHASHTDYAIYFLKRGIHVYIEKPISVTTTQLNDLKEAVRTSSAAVYVGYNRPHSAAIRELVSLMNTGVFTLNCTVIGHHIPEEHWYRKPEEGTRVCGNLGHWIDLAVHLINARGGASSFVISIAYADSNAFDDNLTVVLSTEKGDLITLTLTSRDEPFEGINETIVFQQKNLFVKIDDFRKATFQQGSSKFTRKYRPKDVGHETAIMQPFRDRKRDLDEVFLSTELMLHIMDMVQNNKTSSTFHVSVNRALME